MTTLETLLKLLERKNFCFRSFHKLCLDFVDRIAAGDTSGLEEFQRKREGIIRVLEQIEKDTTLCLDALGREAENKKSPGAQITPDAKRGIELSFREREGLVRSILDLDLQILGHIDRIKDDTIRKLQSVQTSRRTVSAYRSPLDSVENAEGANKAIDHEA